MRRPHAAISTISQKAQRCSLYLRNDIIDAAQWLWFTCFESDSMIAIGVVYIWHRSDSSIISHQECYWSLHYCRLLSLEWRYLSSTTHQQPLLMTVRPQVSQTMIVTVATLFILSFGASTALANEPRGLCRFHYTGSAIIHAPIAISSGGIMSYLIFYYY